MPFSESYNLFPIELIFIDAWLDYMSEFWVHNMQEFLKFDSIGDRTLQPFCNSINLYGGDSYPLYFSMLCLRYLIPLFPIDIAAGCGNAMVLNAL